jgi:RNA polymerase sigma factor (sigma-70 family)
VPVKDSEFRRSLRFDELFEAYCSDIVAYCRWRASSRSDAEDAVSEVFLTAWRRLEDIPQGPDARVWLYATARRVLANQRRSRRRSAALTERLVAEAAVASGESDAGHERALVRAALDRMSERDREVLLLAEWESLSAEQIASVLGCLAVTAPGRLHRSRKRFRAVFEELSDLDRTGSARPAVRSGNPVGRPASARPDDQYALEDEHEQH